MIEYNELEKFISKERLNKYLLLANNNKNYAVQLYKQNIRINTTVSCINMGKRDGLKVLKCI